MEGGEASAGEADELGINPPKAFYHVGAPASFGIRRLQRKSVQKELCSRGEENGKSAPGFFPLIGKGDFYYTALGGKIFYGEGKNGRFPINGIPALIESDFSFPFLREKLKISPEKVFSLPQKFAVLGHAAPAFLLKIMNNQAVLPMDAPGFLFHGKGIEGGLFHNKGAVGPHGGGSVLGRAGIPAGVVVGGMIPILSLPVFLFQIFSSKPVVCSGGELKAFFKAPVE